METGCWVGWGLGWAACKRDEAKAERLREVGVPGAELFEAPVVRRRVHRSAEPSVN